MYFNTKKRLDCYLPRQSSAVGAIDRYGRYVAGKEREKLNF